MRLMSAFDHRCPDCGESATACECPDCGESATACECPDCGESATACECGGEDDGTALEAA
jgi:hypothetical protein